MERGTNVGEGYVKLSIDGSGINKDIENAVEDAAPGVEEQGRQHGKRYGDEFGAASDDSMTRSRDRIGKAWRDKFDRDGADAGEAFSRRVSDVFDRRGDAIGNSLGAMIAASMSDRLETSFANMLDMMEQRLDAAAAERGGGGGGGVSGNSSRKFPPRPADDSLLERAAALNAKYDADHLASLEKDDALGRQWLAMVERAGAMNAKFDADKDLADRKWLATLDMAARMNAKFDADRLKAAEKLTKQNKQNQPGIGNSISGIGASLFGAGIFNALFQGLGGAVNLVEQLTKKLSGAGDGGNSAFTKIIHGAAGGAVAIGALTTVLSVLITTVSGLGGVLTALLSTITSGLTGALAVAATTFGALAVSAGLLVTAFVSLDVAQKKVLKNNFMPLRNEFKGIGQVLDQSLLPATKTWSTNLTNALYLIEPLVKKMGPAFAEAGNSFTKAFSGVGFQQFDKALTAQLPTITVTFTNALGHLLNGLAGLFATLLPYVKEFGFYLNDVAIKFQKWATSAAGHHEIEDFTSRALVSLKSLWNFLTQFGGLLSDVLFSASGQKAGNNMFDGLSASIDNFRKRIAGGEMEAWFARATTFAHNLGEALAALGSFFHALVSDGSMQIVVGILEALSTVLQILTPAISVIVQALNPLVKLIQGFAQVLSVLPSPLQAMIGGIALATVAILKFGPALKAASVALAEFKAANLVSGGSALAGLASSLGAVALKAVGAGVAIGGISLATHAGASSLSILGGAAAAAGGAFLALGGPATGPIAAVGAAVVGVGTALFSFAKRTSDSQKALDDMRNSLIQSATQIGLSTNGWDQLSSSEFRAKTNLIDYTSVLQAAGYSVDAAGNKVQNLRNYILDMAGSLNFSKAQTDALVGGLDNLSPSTIQVLTQAVYGLGDAASSARQQAAQALAQFGALSAVSQQFLLGPGVKNALTQGAKGAIDQSSLIKQIQDAESAAASATRGVGGYAPPPSAYGTGKGAGAGQYNNPYVAYANSLIAQGPSVAAQIKNAILTQNKLISQSLASISKAASGGDVATQINTLTQNIATSAAQMVNTAQSALSSAAQTLASASSAKAAAAALAKVHSAQRDLAAALKNQKLLNAEIAALNKQKVTMSWANTLLKPLGDTSNMSPDQILSQYAHVLDILKKYNGSLADYANARASVAAALTVANQKLAAAIQLRDQYSTTVSDSVKSFGSLITAQAQVVNGIAQALTATDITTNLQTKLNQIKTFQANLKILLAEGLSNDAYKQIVDAGVDQGGAYAQALVNGGVGAVSSTNGLVGQINTLANQLGVESSNRLYQAGVDAAQGLVDGLNSLSKQLDTAATNLGNAIATAVKKSLGIHSPSKVLYGLMYDNVGDGAVNGLDDAAKYKVGPAANRLAARVAVSPEVARYAAAQGQTATVSGNQPHIEVNVETSTADPVAVAHEVVNEIVGRL